MYCDLNVLDSIIFITQMCLHHRVPKRKDFDEDPRKEIRGKSKFSGFERVPGTSYRLDYASRGRDSSYSGFSLHLLMIFVLKWWNVLRVCLGRKMPKTRHSLPRRREVGFA